MEAKGYKKLRLLGKGGFGQAWLIQGKDGKHFVSKDVNLNNMPRAERSLAQNEVKVLRKLVHPNIIQYVDSFEDHGMLHIVMEYADSGDVGSFLKKQRTPLTEEQVLHYFVQICLALKHVHDLKVLHRDLKPQNVFLSQNQKVVKLGDFGISTVLRNSLALARTQCGTPYYFSPELCMNKPYNSKSDVWALGCLLYELMALRPAFDCKNMRQLMQAICQGQHRPIPRQYSRPLQQLVGQMLSQDPKKRPSAGSILKREFIQEQLQKICGKHAVPNAPVFEKRAEREQRRPAQPAQAPPAVAQKDFQPFRPEIKPVHVFEQEKRDQLRREHERREQDRKARVPPPPPQPQALPVRQAELPPKAPMQPEHFRKPPQAHEHRREQPEMRGHDPRREIHEHRRAEPDIRREREAPGRAPPRPEFLGRAPRQPPIPAPPPGPPGREFRQPDFRIERPAQPNPLHGGAERPVQVQRPRPMPPAPAQPKPRDDKADKAVFLTPPKPQPRPHRASSPGRAVERCRSASPHNRGGSPRAKARSRSADPGRRPEPAAPSGHCAAEREARDYHRMVQVIQQILTPKSKGRQGDEAPDGNTDDVFGDDQDQVAYMLSFRLNGRPLELPDAAPGDPLPQRVIALRRYLEETLGKEIFNKVYAILLDSSEDLADSAVRRQAFLVVGEKRRAYVELVSQLIFCEGVCDQKDS